MQGQPRLLLALGLLGASLVAACGPGEPESAGAEAVNRPLPATAQTALQPPPSVFLNFDELTEGSHSTHTYADRGVVIEFSRFDSPTDWFGFSVDDFSADTARFPGASPPMVLSGGGFSQGPHAAMSCNSQIAFRFVAPATGAPARATSVEVVVIGTGICPPTAVRQQRLRAFDAQGRLVDTATLAGSPDCQQIVSGRLRVQGSISYAVADADGPDACSAYDDLRFTLETQGLGQPCGADPARCSSGLCVDGVCCDAPCAGQCQTCGGVAGGAAAGRCATVRGVPAAGHAACAGSGSCAGLCDGVHPATCAFPDGATACAGPACTGGVYSAASRCDGAGGCASLAPEPCAPYVCGAANCKTNCGADTDCIAGYYCESGRCEQRLYAAVRGGCTSGGAPGAFTLAIALLCLRGRRRANCTSGGLQGVSTNSASIVS